MPSGAQALKEVQIIRFSHLKHGSLTSSRWAMPIIYKGLVHPEDTKAGHTEIFSILQQKKHGRMYTADSCAIASLLKLS